MRVNRFRRGTRRGSYDVTVLSPHQEGRSERERPPLHYPSLFDRPCHGDSPLGRLKDWRQWEPGLRGGRRYSTKTYAILRNLRDYTQLASLIQRKWKTRKVYGKDVGKPETWPISHAIYFLFFQFYHLLFSRLCRPRASQMRQRVM